MCMYIRIRGTQNMKYFFELTVWTPPESQWRERLFSGRKDDKMNLLCQDNGMFNAMGMPKMKTFTTSRLFQTGAW
jgi:hypothetical protein